MTTVKEFAEMLLREYPHDAILVGKSDNFEKKGSIVDSVITYGTIMKKEKEEFVDAFDYQKYKSDVYRHSDSKKDSQKCVVVSFQ